MMQERRRYQRLVPDLPLFVRMEEINSGRLLDIGEGGLALGGFVPKPLDNVFSLAFELPDAHGLIRARAEIAWINTSVNRTGVRFVELADTCRQRLREWVSVRAHPTEEDMHSEILHSMPVPIHATEALTRTPAISIEPTAGTTTRRTPLRHPMEVGLAAVVLCSAFVCIGYYLPSIGSNSNVDGQGSASVANTKAAASEEFVAPVSTSTIRSTPSPPRLSLDLPGYVIQVGAMAREDNADALAVTLHRMNFPAFVFRRNGDRFYRVVVGPYGDASSTIQIKTQIENQGFEAILRHWSPQ